MSDKQNIMQEIEAVVGEVQELLRKSGLDLHKDGEEDEAGQAEPAAAEGQESDAIADAAAPESEEAPAPEQEAPEAAEGEAEDHEGLKEEADDSQGDLAAEAQSLSDEELEHLLEVLMSEKDSRGAQQAPEAAAAPAAPAPAPAEKSMKEDYAKLGKSLESLAGAIEGLNKKVDALSQKPQSKVVVKAPAANAQEVRVLHKSQPAAKRLTKSETIDFLHNQLKSGNKLVDRNIVLDVVASKSDEELHGVQDSLVKMGIQLPKL